MCKDSTHLKNTIVGHGMIHPKDTSSDVVSDEDIHGVVSVGDHDENDAQKSD